MRNSDAAGHLAYANVTLCKDTDQSSNASSDMPNKKPRLVLRAISSYPDDSLLILYRHTMPERKLTIPEAPVPLEVAPSLHRNGTSTPGLYKTQVKDPVEIKSPQLPLIEKTALAAVGGGS